MVNQNHARGRVRLPLKPGGRGYRVRRTRARRRLRPGDVVVPNFWSAHARRGHPPGVILEVADGWAEVRWRDELRPRRIELELLVKA